MSRNFKGKSQESRVSNPFGAAQSSSFGQQPVASMGAFGSSFGTFGSVPQNPFQAGTSQAGFAPPGSQSSSSNPFQTGMSQTAFGSTGFQSSSRHPFEQHQAPPVFGTFSQSAGSQSLPGSLAQISHGFNSLTPEAKMGVFRISESQFPSFVPRNTRSLTKGMKAQIPTESDLDIFRTKNLSPETLIPNSPPPLELR